MPSSRVLTVPPKATILVPALVAIALVATSPLSATAASPSADLATSISGSPLTALATRTTDHRDEQRSRHRLQRRDYRQHPRELDVLLRERHLVGVWPGAIRREVHTSDEFGRNVDLQDRIASDRCLSDRVDGRQARILLA
jgi:hypothetical protein